MSRISDVVTEWGSLTVVTTDSLGHLTWQFRLKLAILGLIESLHLYIRVSHRLLISSAILALSCTRAILFVTFIHVKLILGIILGLFLNKLKVIVAQSPLRRGSGLYPISISQVSFLASFNHRGRFTPPILHLVKAWPLIALLAIISAKHGLNSDVVRVRYRQLVGPSAQIMVIHTSIFSCPSSGLHLRRIELEGILAHTPVEVGIVRC